MHLSKTTHIAGLGLLVKDTLVIADLHLGYEESLNKKGVMIPRFQFQDIVKHLTLILEQTKPSCVVINGDLKHDFGTISAQEWRESLKIFDLIAKYTKDIVVVKGNHDPTLQWIAKKRTLVLADYHVVGEVFITHGDSIPETLPANVTTLVISHEHPAVSIREGTRTEKYKCFLKGTWKHKRKEYDLIVMPSFNPITAGTDITSQKLLSPFLKDNKKLDDFEVFIVEDTVYPFGTVGDLGG
jgi:uncharacterized protein